MVGALAITRGLGSMLENRSRRMSLLSEMNFVEKSLMWFLYLNRGFKVSFT